MERRSDMKRIQNKYIICAGFGFCALNSAVALIPQQSLPREVDSFCRYGTHCHERFPTGHAERFVYLANNFSDSQCELDDLLCSKSRLVADRLAGRGSRLFVIPDAVSTFRKKNRKSESAIDGKHIP